MAGYDHDAIHPHRRYRSSLIAVAFSVIGSATGAALGATFTIDIFATEDPEAEQITVAPNDMIAYTVVGEMFSDDDATPDNEGLAGLIFDIVTDLGVTQPAATEIDPDVAAALSFQTSTGTSDGDDLLQLGGLQLILDDAVTDLAVGGPQVIAQGVLVAPDVEGTFIVAIPDDGTVLALVRQDDGGFLTGVATLEPGIGLTVVTDASLATGDGTSDGTTGDDTDATEDQPVPVGDLVLIIATAVGLGLFGGLAAGPVAGAVGILVGMMGVMAALLLGAG
jgi:hypothetical protein